MLGLTNGAAESAQMADQTATARWLEQRIGEQLRASVGAAPPGPSPAAPPA